MGLIDPDEDLAMDHDFFDQPLGAIGFLAFFAGPDFLLLDSCVDLYLERDVLGLIEKRTSVYLLVSLDAIDIPSCRVEDLLDCGFFLLYMEDPVGGEAAQPTIIFGFLLARLRRRPPVFTLSPNISN